MVSTRAKSCPHPTTCLLQGVAALLLAVTVCSVPAGADGMRVYLEQGLYTNTYLLMDDDRTVWLDHHDRRWDAANQGEELAGHFRLESSTEQPLRSGDTVYLVSELRERQNESKYVGLHSDPEDRQVPRTRSLALFDTAFSWVIDNGNPGSEITYGDRICLNAFLELFGSYTQQVETMSGPLSHTGSSDDPRAVWVLYSDPSWPTGNPEPINATTIHLINTMTLKEPSAPLQFVPNVLDMPYEDAEAALTEAGFQVSMGDPDLDSRCNGETPMVVSQSVPAGTAAMGSPVTLSLCDANAYDISPGPVINFDFNSDEPVGARFYAALMTNDGEHFVTAELDQETLSATATEQWVRERFEIFSPDGEDIVSGGQVIIRTVHGKYWTPYPDGELRARVDEIGNWEPFTIQRIGGQPGDAISFGDQVAFLGVHGTYVYASHRGGAGMKAAGPRIGGGEPFTLVPPGQGLVGSSFHAALLTNDGEHFVTAHGDAETLSAIVTHTRGYERFEIFSPDGNDIVSGDQVIIRTHHDKYWTAYPDGALRARVDEIGNWEPFTIERIGGEPGDPISFGDRVAFLGAHGLYVYASNRGGAGMKAAGPQIGGGEPFTLVEHAP